MSRPASRPSPSRPPARRPRGRPLDPEAGFRRVAAQIAKQIATGHYAPQELLPSQRRLAAVHGVSENTVRRAMRLLRSQGLLRFNAEGRAALVPPGHELHTKPGYLLEVVSAPLRQALQAAYFASLQRGIESGAGALNAPLVIVHAVRYRSLLPDDPLRLPLQGILLVGQFRSAVLSKYLRFKVPTVVVDMPVKNLKLHCVCADNEQASFELTRTLLSQGHRRIAFLRRVRFDIPGVDTDARERQRGFERALGEAGIVRAGENVYNIFRKDGSASPGIRSILRARPSYTALVACDPTAARLCEKALAKDGGPGSPIGVHTFLSQDEPSKRLAARFDFFKMGLQAVEMLEAPRNPARLNRIPAAIG